MSETSSSINILFIGDVVGRGGRSAVKALVPELKKKYSCSFVIVNAENCANGSGMTSACLEEMPEVDVFTSGDHVWDQKTFETEITKLKNVLRPANMSSVQPGKGWGIFRNKLQGDVAVISLMGKVFMRDSAYCPFETAENVLKNIPVTVKCIIIDFHGEATSEKAGLAWFLDGRVTAVLGTHTHVQTADARILPNGTAFMSDVGMVGGRDSILGRDVKDVVKKFRTGMPNRLNVTESGIVLNGAVVSCDLATGKATKITPISIAYDKTCEQTGEAIQ